MTCLGRWRAQSEIHLQTQWPLDLMSVAHLCFAWDAITEVQVTENFQELYPSYSVLSSPVLDFSFNYF